MEFRVEKALLDIGLKILFVKIEGVDNKNVSSEWMEYRRQRLNELATEYENIDIKRDPILEGFNILHDRAGVKRRKNIPASENLIKLLNKNKGMFFINQVVDIYNLISLESKLCLGAHNIDTTEGNLTLRITDGTEKFIPLGATESIGVNRNEYCYCDDSNEVLCRCEIRQVNKTRVDEDAQNVFFIIQGNDASSDELMMDTAQKLVKTVTKYCGGKAEIIIPEVI